MLVFLMVGFSGCTEFGTNREDERSCLNSKYKLVSSSIVTSYDYPTKYSVNWGDPYDYVTEEKDGFFSNFPKDSRNEKYVISGTVKNIAGYKSNIKVNLKFYDNNDVFLDSKSFTIWDVPDTYEETFTKRYNDYDIDYFSNVDKVTFDLS